MVIDFHTHVFPEKIAGTTVALLQERAHITAASDGTTEGLIHTMQEGGADKSVVLPVVTSPKQFDSILRFAEGLRAYSELIPFGGIHPDSSDYKARLRLLAQHGFPGIKLHPDYQEVFFNDIRYKRIVAYAMELDLIVVVHAGIDVGLPKVVHCTPKMSAEVLDEVRPDRLVLAHYGGWKQWEQVEQELVGRDVYLDTSYTLGCIEQQQFLRILKQHGSDKILFATDSPWMGQKESIELLSGLPLPEQDKEAVFYKNAAHLLGLSSFE